MLGFFVSAKFSRFTVSFDDELFAPTKRIENHSWSDFIASAGGLFSLCMGASILSIVELIYYFVLHIFVTYFNGRKQTNTKRMIFMIET